MSELRLGLIGCGPMGRKLADSLAKRNDARVTVVADPVEEARRQAAEAYDAQSCAHWEELLSRSDIEAVVVATPSYLHPPIAIAAAQSRKHIFCEKPMALHVADCDAMIQAAAGAGVKLMVGQVLRLMFPFWRIKQLADDGVLVAPIGYSGVQELVASKKIAGKIVKKTICDVRFVRLIGKHGFEQ